MPDLAAFTFAGTESIEITVVEQTDTITLHTSEIVIVSASAAGNASTGISYDPKAETCTIKFSAPLQPGSTRLEIEFTGVLNDQV